MRRRSLAGLTAIAVTGGTLLATGTPAQAAEPTTLYVKKAAANCSDQGPGSATEPFCTIGAATAVVTAGQDVRVYDGDYAERVTFTRSGTPDAPIGFIANGSAVRLVGPTAGLVIDGQHDIGLQDFKVNGTLDLPVLDIRNSSNIEVAGGLYTMASAATAPVVRVTGVTVASLRDIFGTATALTNGITVDATSTDVTVERATVATGSQYDSADHSSGIRVEGTRNSVLDSVVGGFTGAAIEVGPGASGTVLANNDIRGGAGHGIHNRGAANTAITNNSIAGRCVDGVRVDGASSGVSVQNNTFNSNGQSGQSFCDPQATGGVEIGVYDQSLTSTVVDYNNTYPSASPSLTNYSWNGAVMGLAQFRTASGQAAHDRDTANARDRIDSANSAAPGFPDRDSQDQSRRDDPAVTNTGAGPITYADRGIIETVKSPTASFDVSLDLGASSATVDASSSTPGFVPIREYVFNFGDGTNVTQVSPTATHRYATPGTYDVTVTARGSDDLQGSSTEKVSVLRRTATVGLLALSNRRYVATAAPILLPNQVGLTAAAQYDLADAGNGQVALVARANGRYVTQLANESLNAAGQAVGTPEKFTVVRNSDGTVSLKASNNLYVTADPGGAISMSASRSTISAWEKFAQVPVADANRSLKASVNGRFVMADAAGVKPLIASQTSASTWERFDIADLGSGQVALFARANSRFVSADGAGSKPLIANGPAISTWERFTIVRNSDGTVSFKAGINNKYVSADGAGSKPLIANGPAISTWEKFTLG
ncbi:right-handed parallel beta-helix repeat-containing protein [Micromonospora sp. D93]|uniref:PKD domain-containing protein n=1 Tax=Micromonospora sp. D93 TaxID=2824886 RepID=UPI001B38DB28|nr:PKD domain-containing protein [Micromonospora sp. D93]MBQ1019009.1 right-handed parallel beta-helix repeat-containing protein [Micromonospora sp. D93]